MRLVEEVKSPSFLHDISVGLYGIVFYNGINKKMANGIRKTKSLLLSRRLSLADRLQILGRETQTVYLVDVDVLRCLLEVDCVLRAVRNDSACQVHPADKYDARFKRRIIYLNRTFLEMFVTNPLSKEVRLVMDASIGEGRWIIAQKAMEVEFSGEECFKVGIPVNFIGRRRTWKQLEPRMNGVVFDVAQVLSQDQAQSSCT